jgi:ribosomal protein S12 methylthiotransferase
MPLKKKINVITLGCSKNLVDSEYLMKQLDAAGFQLVHDVDSFDAPVVIINTCGFILDAKNESIDTILRFGRARKEKKIDKLFVMGCLSQRYKNELEKEIPEVDAFYGVNDMPQILKSLQVDLHTELLGERYLTTPSHYAYLKISEGCSRKCSFCSIPLIRGEHKSREIHDIINEAEILLANGSKELILIAQDLSYYGFDLYKEFKLPLLLQKLATLKDLGWLRLHYAFPANFPFEVLQVIKDNPLICRYLDIPFQHISDSMLKSMRRGITRQKTYDLIDAIRKEIPDIALRTTLMVGYPGETDSDFNELINFVKEVRFERLGIFAYSHEEGTYAYIHHKDDVPEEVKTARVDKIMQIQQKISAELNQKKRGKDFKVIIDRKENDFYIGRTQYDSPEIDDEVLISSSNQTLSIGEFYEVTIDSAAEFDLYGSIKKP